MFYLGFLLLQFAANSYGNVDAFRAIDLLNQKQIQIPASNKPSVLVFLSAKCPCSGSHEAALKNLHAQYHGQFDFIGIHSNQDEAKNLAVEHFKNSALPFAVVQDEGAKIANHYKALKTPHVFVVKENKILFEGGVDDSNDTARAQKFYLKDALSEITNNKPVTLAKARTLGCAIKR